MSATAESKQQTSMITDPLRTLHEISTSAKTIPQTHSRMLADADETLAEKIAQIEQRCTFTQQQLSSQQAETERRVAQWRQSVNTSASAVKNIINERFPWITYSERTPVRQNHVAPTEQQILSKLSALAAASDRLRNQEVDDLIPKELVFCSPAIALALILMNFGASGFFIGFIAGLVLAVMAWFYGEMAWVRFVAMGLPSISGAAIGGAILGLGGFVVGAVIGVIANIFFLRRQDEASREPTDVAVSSILGDIADCRAMIDGYQSKAVSTIKAASIASTTEAENDSNLVKSEYEAIVKDLNRRTRQALLELEESAKNYISTVGVAIWPWFETVYWSNWTPATEIRRLASIGSSWVTINDEPYNLPIAATMPEHASLLFHGSGAKDAHVSEALLLRYLTSFPAGKLQFTLFDPVGLGRNVSSLMHLHDYRPELLNDRAWIEPRHIEERLAELSETMQNIIQKYLRTTYATMEEYNEAAGEVAEPYRLLVVNNFPVNFTQEALRHLVSIVQNGPKCGVYTVIAVDDTQELPYKFNIGDLEEGCTVFHPTHRVGVGNVPGFSGWPYEPEEMPSGQIVQHILDVIGTQAAANSVVQVPFAGVAPPEHQWWTESSRDGLTAPLGITGARKPQLLEIGKGTAQTALVVGRVGSGKSTLLHTAIMNLALTYSPEELELYLLDFKKGVEFKTYAVHKLPHAKAIAVESEREFALSVLQKLDRELDDRGRLFRSVTETHGEAPNIQSYRTKTGRTLPRVLLLVDEFQEFFTESDTLAQQAGLLLDRLVRQGRAFGIHVILGSQSLAGAYSLAKSTLDQMAIRIALQCSEADSRLVFSDDNPAARLLNRPGEAIYNDENGRIEGNDLFQTAWLTDEERDAYLDQLASMADKQFPDRPEPVVFEGNVTADPSRNRQLAEILRSSDRVAKGPVVRAWVGDPIAIADPAAAQLRDQAGANLIIIGQDEEIGYGMLATSVIGIARQHELTGETANISVVDMSSVDSPYASLFQEVGGLFPDMVRISGRRSVVPVVERTYQELERRMAEGEPGVSNRLYLVVVGLNRARDLREDEDGGGMGFFGEEKAEKTSNQMFQYILKEGPDFGIHVIAWADTLNNLSRVVDRRSLREFDLRVVLQMSVDDSNTLVDTPAASRLGPNRALLYSEEQGTSLKFRPYGVPSPEWLDEVRQRSPVV